MLLYSTELGCCTLSVFELGCCTLSVLMSSDVVAELGCCTLSLLKYSELGCCTLSHSMLYSIIVMSSDAVLYG